MKRNKNRLARFSWIGFLLFLLTIAVTSTLSIFVYYFATTRTNHNEVIVVIAVAGIIIVGAFLCTIIDMARRRNMVERPVEKILYATKKIASGDFSVKLEHKNEYSKYNQYDLIIDNINTMVAELSKNEMLKNDFISNVSHEIKTPLAVIQNYARVLQNKNLDKIKKDEYLNGLIIQTKKLSELISNILKLNKLENQKIVPEMEEFDLAELIRNAIISFESLFERKDIQVKCNLDEVCIYSSKNLLEIVINNLISNAIKFTNPNGLVCIGLKKYGEFVEVSVKDNGCGISKEVGVHIFDKFYQGDTSRSSEGNGLGLALVKKVIDVLGGEISVESKVSIGSTFTIKLKR